MTPEMNKNEGLPNGAEPDATQRTRSRTAERRTARNENGFWLASRCISSVPGMGGRGSSRKAKSNREERRPKQRTLASCRRCCRHDLRVSGHVLKFERNEGPCRKQNETESRQAGCQGRSRRKPGSVTPLLNADVSGQDGNSDQLSADDVKATGRLRVHPQPKPGDTLASIPPMDPALEAYRQAKAGNPVPQPPPMVASVPVAAPVPAHNEGDALKKSSLVFVSANSGASASVIRPASMTTEPALLERRATALLPNGSRLVARLQSAVSTAVKAPVVAAIEYNYERDGEIIIPAGAKAFGELQQANRNGNIGIHFHTLQMPDGTTEKIDAGSMSLTYGPLKGSVSGGNAVKRILVRSLTGVGNNGGLSGWRAGWPWRGKWPARQQHSVARAHRVERRARGGAGG